MESLGNTATTQCNTARNSTSLPTAPTGNYVKYVNVTCHFIQFEICKFIALKFIIIKGSTIF